MTNRCNRLSFADKSSGFTLLEMLLVVLIVGIMTAAGANLINNQSIERVIMNQAQQFETNLKYICERAVLENQAFGVEWLSGGYQVLRHQSPNWLLIEQQPTILPEATSNTLYIDGYPQILTDEVESLPHIICQSDGSFNAFELRFAANENSSQSNSKTYYSLMTTTPWEVTGGWHQP